VNSLVLITIKWKHQHFEWNGWLSGMLLSTVKILGVHFFLSPCFASFNKQCTVVTENNVTTNEFKNYVKMKKSTKGTNAQTNLK